MNSVTRNLHKLGVLRHSYELTDIVQTDKTVTVLLTCECGDSFNLTKWLKVTKVTSDKKEIEPKAKGVKQTRKHIID